MNTNTAYKTITETLAQTKTIFYRDVISNPRQTTSAIWQYFAFVPDTNSKGMPTTRIVRLTASIYHLLNDGDSVPTKFKGIKTSGNDAMGAAQDAFVRCVGHAGFNELEFKSL